jgi:hypothetical protein
MGFAQEFQRRNNAQRAQAAEPRLLTAIMKTVREQQARGSVPAPNQSRVVDRSTEASAWSQFPTPVVRKVSLCLGTQLCMSSHTMQEALQRQSCRDAENACMPRW